MQEIQYTTVDRILSKLYRELPEEEIHEDDVIEWIGEALDFLNVPKIQEQTVYIGQVKDYQIDIPKHLQYIIQIARYDDSHNNHIIDSAYPQSYDEQLEFINDSIKKLHPSECKEPCMFPYFNMNINFKVWKTSPIYTSAFRPVRLANHSFFNSLVCSESNELVKDLYDNCYNCFDEYSIVGTTNQKIRFSFREGIVAISYIRAKIDDETGYPYIPDNSSYISAITYYIKWKLSEFKAWTGDKVAMNLMPDFERKWIKYAGQAKNNAKMPSSIDEYQNLLEGSRSILPRNKYYGFFGNLGREPHKLFI